MASVDAEVAVVGGGVVGCAVAHALARRGVTAIVLEAEAELALGASGSNSGILHTGFDSPPGELETALILRASELRAELLGELGVEVRRCGALLRPADARQTLALAELAENARTNGVAIELEPDGVLAVSGEAITDPVDFVHALAAALQAGGGSVSLSSRVVGLARAGGAGVELALAGGGRVSAHAAVNCAGLHADEVAGMAGERPVEIYPRKGEFLVFREPAQTRLQRILLPLPSTRGKGVLVFPTIDGFTVAGPTARDREDKHDRSVEAGAAELIMEHALALHPPLVQAEQVGVYAGLRPAGRRGNYVIQGSRSLPGLVHVAAIRSTGLSASLAIGEHVAGMLAEATGLRLGATRPLPAPPREPAELPWWARAAAGVSAGDGVSG